MKTLKTAIAASLIAVSLSAQASFVADFVETTVEGAVVVVIGTGVILVSPFWLAGKVFHVIEDGFTEGE